MEFRKEKSENSKQIIRKLYQSDIFNISTGFYKKEKTQKITPKPNESSNYEIGEFVPKYKEINPYMRLYNNLMSHQQKYNSKFEYIKPALRRQNSEIQVLRSYDKIIKDNCFDEKGNFSANKRYRLEFFGKDNTDKNTYKNMNKTFYKSIRESRNQEKDLKTNYSTSTINKRKESHREKVNSCKNIFGQDNIKYMNLLPIPKIKKKDADYNNYNLKKQKEEENKTGNNFNKKGEKNEKKVNPPNYNKKDLTKYFYTKSNEVIKPNRVVKKGIEEKDYFKIEIKADDKNRNKILVDQKKLKQLFLKNGIHLYDFNEDKMNNLFREKKYEAKLRKNKNDENFDKNYRKVVRELNKINVTVKRYGMIIDTGFISSNLRPKRKGTPGKNLIKNKENK